jgi:aryl-alcohol dehydrogenase-like predicted oxidoreductase
MTLAPRRLGAGPLEVLPIALGTWRTFERLPRERALELLDHAFEAWRALPRRGAL